MTIHAVDLIYETVQTGNVGCWLFKRRFQYLNSKASDYRIIREC
jgi:hypothetical protein